VKMRAAILERPGSPVRIEMVEIPALRRGQVLVKIAFSGICRSQLMEVTGGRGIDRYLPHLLGHEGSGTVLEIGADVTKVIPGDKAVLTWIKGKGLDAGGSQYALDGQVVNAGAVTTFSEYAVISENRCVPIPDDIDMCVASLLGCAVPTGAGIVLNELRPTPGESVGVWGLGGIGLSAVMGASASGCSPIIALDVNEEKLAQAHEFGATHLIDVRNVDANAEIQNITSGLGLDYCVEAAGKTQTIEAAFASVRDNGGLCVFASHPPTGESIALDPHALIRGKRIQGSWGGKTNPDEDIPTYIEMYQQNKLPLEKLITHRFALDEINDALELLASGLCGRIVIDMGGS